MNIRGYIATAFILLLLFAGTRNAAAANWCPALYDGENNLCWQNYWTWQAVGDIDAEAKFEACEGAAQADLDYCNWFATHNDAPIDDSHYMETCIQGQSGEEYCYVWLSIAYEPRRSNAQFRNLMMVADHRRRRWPVARVI
jgi:hypothetical protein